MSDYSGLEEFAEVLEQIYGILFYGYGIAELGIGGIILLCTIIGAIISSVMAVVKYLLEVIPIYVLSKKAGRKNCWIAWVPIAPFRMYVLADIAGEKELRIFENSYGKFLSKLAVKNRSTSFWIYIGVRYLGSTAITIIITLLNFLIPVIGQILGAFTTVLYLIPTIVTGCMEYAYLRDTMNRFQTDKKSNSTKSLVITILDKFVTFGLARSFYLYTLLKCQALPEEESRPEPQQYYAQDNQYAYSAEAQNQNNQ